jgi:hypothetical protein
MIGVGFWLSSKVKNDLGILVGIDKHVWRCSDNGSQPGDRTPALDFVPAGNVHSKYYSKVIFKYSY